jgi:hypothetical protein
VCVNGNCIEVQTGECLCGVYWVGFGLKKEDALSLFAFSRALFYAIWKVKQNKREK